MDCQRGLRMFPETKRMTGLWRVLTAVMLVTHLLVGCCAHHAHACEGYPASGQDPAASHGECPDGQHHPSDHADHGPYDCLVSPCSFITSDRTAGDSFPDGLQAVTMPLPEEAASLRGVLSGQRFSPTGRLALPVRLHLANQVLLI